MQYPLLYFACQIEAMTNMFNYDLKIVEDTGIKGAII